MSMLSGVRVQLPNGQSATPPTWASKVRLTTVLEQNDQGSWYGVKFAMEGLVAPNSLEYIAGKEFHASLMQGTAGEVRYAEPAEAASDAF
jgi:hypothetical protein